MSGDSIDERRIIEMPAELSDARLHPFDEPLLIALGLPDVPNDLLIRTDSETCADDRAADPRARRRRDRIGGGATLGDPPLPIEEILSGDGDVLDRSAGLQ